MQFSIEEYKARLFVGPLIQLAVAIFLIFNIIFLIKKHGVKKSCVFVAVCSILCVVFAYISISKLRYGYVFFSKTEADAVQESGTIENVRVWDDFACPKFILEYNDNSRGVFVTIDGVEYIFMGQGDLQIGDRVDISYLQQVNIVLETHKPT